MGYLAPARAYFTNIMRSGVTDLRQELPFLGTLMDPAAWATNDCGGHHLAYISSRQRLANLFWNSRLLESRRTATS